MTAKIIDGTAVAQQLRAKFRERAEALAALGRRPGLAVIIAGINPASQVYVRNKVKACAEAGFESWHIEFPADASQADLLAEVARLNADPKVHGILVQLPLPPQIDAHSVIEAIAPGKDVDGFHFANLGALFTGAGGFVPCTPAGVMELIAGTGIEVAGRDAVIIGRSNIVGKPLALLLLQAGATVTICHSRTADLAAHTRRADILVAALGRPNFVKAEMVKPGACVIDVGINRITEGPRAGKLAGDVDFDAVREVAGWITPVPGGVGPMTIAMLLANTFESCGKPMNPLLDFSGLPRFADIRAEHIGPAIDALIAEGRAVTARCASDASGTGWDDFIAPLEDVNEKLSRAWGAVGHLHSVVDSPELREAYNQNLPKVTEYWTDLGQNLGLFNKYKALAGSAAYSGLSRARRTIIDNEVRDFRLSGAELPDREKARFKEIQEQQAELGAKFSENVLDATNAFALYIDDEKRLVGLPQDVIDAAREAAQKDGKEGWKLTMHAPSYIPVLQYADDRALRETIYRANVTRASEFGDAKYDNTALISRIVALRDEEARLLGYQNFAEVSLVPKMAGTPGEVLKFLDDLARRARPFAERDYVELKAYAKEHLGLAPLEAWDNMYASEKLRQARYAFSDQEVKEYFPEHKVLAGLFKVVETVFSVRIRPDAAPVWHEDVRFFRIETPEGKLVGQFYIDLYARDTKRGGAWMDDAVNRRAKAGEVQTPVTYLTCNFARPVGKDRPALFTHDDVITLFHEFGHGLHHMLTRVDDLGVAGINGVEWDAVELPSQFMENFCWEWDVLKHMTAHVDTGAPLPRALFDKMIAAKNFQAGMQTVRQIEYSLFDMHVHYDFDPARQTPLQMLDALRQRVSVVIPPAYNRFINSFSHIFGGGYAAGYYSYKWAEVLSADAYSAFEEEGVLSSRAGARFRDEVLAVGGSRPAAESFRAFRGRDPTLDALLRHNGMITA